MFLTITLNPAVDKIATVEKLMIGQNNPIRLTDTFAAGRGVDVAKALRELGYPVTAGGFLGGNSTSIFERLFISRGINDAFIRIKDATRSNMHVIDADGNETELMEPSPRVSAAEWHDFGERTGRIFEGCELVAVCGSVPDGVTPKMFSDLLKHIKRYDLPLLLDVPLDMLEVVYDKAPDLIKFNRQRISEAIGKEDPSRGEMIAYGKGLVAKGVKNVLISLDKDGALLINGEGVFSSDVPRVNVQSTIGCGDTMVASVAESLSKGRKSAEMLRHAVALAAANAMTLETAHVVLSDYRDIVERIKVEKIG